MHLVCDKFMKKRKSTECPICGREIISDYYDDMNSIEIVEGCSCIKDNPFEWVISFIKDFEEDIVSLNITDGDGNER